MATAIEWAATASSRYLSFEEHYNAVRRKVISEKPDHWLSKCPSVKSLVDFCKSEKPDYEVHFRSEDTFPLMSVPGATTRECISPASNGEWKDWDKVLENANIFQQCIGRIYRE